MENGGLILWNAVAICETSKTSWQMGKLLMKSSRRIIERTSDSFLGQRLNVIRFLQETSNLARKFYQEDSSDMHKSRTGIWKGDVLVAGGTVQYKLNAQSLRLFGLHSDVNDAHRAAANRFQHRTKKMKPGKISGLFKGDLLHLSSSRRTSSSAQRAQRRNIP